MFPGREDGPCAPSPSCSASPCFSPFPPPALRTRARPRSNTSRPSLVSASRCRTKEARPRRAPGTGAAVTAMERHRAAARVAGPERDLVRPRRHGGRLVPREGEATPELSLRRPVRREGRLGRGQGRDVHAPRRRAAAGPASERQLQLFGFEGDLAASRVTAEWKTAVLVLSARAGRGDEDRRLIRCGASPRSSSTNPCA